MFSGERKPFRFLLRHESYCLSGSNLYLHFLKTFSTIPQSFPVFATAFSNGGNK